MDRLKNLTDEELFEKYLEHNDIAARDEIFERYLYIAKIVAKKFSGRGIDYEDLYQTASVALIKAIDRFDYKRGVQFNTFATPSLIGEIKNYFRDTSRLVRVPRGDVLLMKKMADFISEYQSENGEMPNVQYLAEKLDVTEDKVLELFEMKRTSSPVYMDAPVDNDNETDFADMLGEEENGFMKIENQDFFRYCLSQLNEDEKTVVIDRFVQRKSQSDIAKKLGVSQMQVSRMERKILNKLKTVLS